MIVLDTNIVSEMMRPAPEALVVAWLTSQAASGLFTTALTQAEVLYGLTLLPEGRRREELFAAARPIFDEDLSGRILPFDSHAALIYPDIVAGRRQAGRPISQVDAQIASIARSRGARLATRNVRDFEDCGLVLVDPWTAG